MMGKSLSMGQTTGLSQKNAFLLLIVSLTHFAKLQ